MVIVVMVVVLVVMVVMVVTFQLSTPDLKVNTCHHNIYYV